MSLAHLDLPHPASTCFCSIRLSRFVECDNKPGAHMAMGRWGQEMWLSDRDFLNGLKAAIAAPKVQFAALNLMSNNPGMRWDLEETKRVIGYTPQDGSPGRSAFFNRC